MITGIAVRLGGIGGALMMTMIYLSSTVWPEYNPFVDEHVIYALISLGVAATPRVGAVFGLGRRWTNLAAVKNKPFLH